MEAKGVDDLCIKEGKETYKKKRVGSKEAKYNGGRLENGKGNWGQANIKNRRPRLGVLCSPLGGEKAGKNGVIGKGRISLLRREGKEVERETAEGPCKAKGLRKLEGLTVGNAGLS